MDGPALLDEHTGPGMRRLWGRLLARSRAVDVAVTHVRLATLDFGSRELRRVRRVRVLVSELSAASLEAEGHAAAARPEAAAALARLLALLDEGRLAVRSSPLGGWSPDFSVFHDEGGPAAALVGSHRFDAPGPGRGPLLVSLHRRSGASLAAERFSRLWIRGHDVDGPVRSILWGAGRTRPAQGHDAAEAPAVQRLAGRAAGDSGLDSPPTGD